MNKSILPTVLIFMLSAISGFATPGEVRNPNIHSIKLFKKGNQTSMPVITLGGIEQLELHFDDLQKSTKSYYYTYELCNADWTPVNLSPMDYIRGFTQNRITQYRFSSIAYTRYVHYQIDLPQANCVPSRSGNYLLKVFANSDTAQLLFSRRMMVTDSKVVVAASIQQPFSPELFRTHQKVVTNVNFGSLDVFNAPQQIKVVVLQNYSWDNAKSASNPTFIRGNVYEYSNETNFVFEGGKEWRWLDLRSFRLQSDRVRRIDNKENSYDIYPVPDSVRNPLGYVYYKDLNGQYFIETLEDINPWWQGDYGRVHFTFLPYSTDDVKTKRFYVCGELTGYQTSADNEMTWNDDKVCFEKELLLKNGYYNYCYMTKDARNPNAPASFQGTEGSVWDTENQYSVFVYYRGFSGRSDELVGYTETNSFNFIKLGK